MRENPNEMLNLAGNSFGEIIREYRIKKGMTQGELGALVRVKKNAVGAWEAGRSRPDLASVPILCNTLGIPIHVFFGMDAPETFSPFQRRFSQLNSKHQQIILGDLHNMFSGQRTIFKKSFIITSVFLHRVGIDELVMDSPPLIVTELESHLAADLSVFPVDQVLDHSDLGLSFHHLSFIAIINMDFINAF